LQVQKKEKGRLLRARGTEKNADYSGSRGKSLGGRPWEEQVIRSVKGERTRLGMGGGRLKKTRETKGRIPIPQFRLYGKVALIG